MNIVVVGAGQKGRFGNDFVKRAKLEGHNVRVLSHRPGADTDGVFYFLNLEQAIDTFNKITEDFNNIDLLLYNSSYHGFPDDPKYFTSNGVIKEKLYTYGFYIQVLIPHALSIEALKRMSNRSKIIFMTTDVIYDRERTEKLYDLGYYGGKAYQHQLMLALADLNDKGTSVSSVSPFFDYNNPQEYNKTFNKVYDHILGEVKNGKVFDCWE